LLPLRSLRRKVLNAKSAFSIGTDSTHSVQSRTAQHRDIRAFKEYDAEILASQGYPDKTAFLKRAYKSKMSCSEFIEEWAKLRATSRAKGLNKKQYANDHKTSERYEKLDNKFNFFGNYED
jgi:hypothetical protein